MLLRRRALEIVALSDKTERELSHAEDVLPGEIAIGSVETKNIQALTRMMAEFRKEHPDVTFDMYTATADDIKERLERGLVDIGVLVEPVRSSDIAPGPKGTHPPSLQYSSKPALRASIHLRIREFLTARQRPR